MHGQDRIAPSSSWTILCRVSFPRCSLFTTSLVFSSSLVFSFWSPKQKLSTSTTALYLGQVTGGDVWKRGWQRKRKRERDETKGSNGIWSHFWELQLRWTEKTSLSLWGLEFGLQLLPLQSLLPPLLQDNMESGINRESYLVPEKLEKIRNKEMTSPTPSEI